MAIWGGGGRVLISCIAVVLIPLTLASLQCQDGARRVLTDQADIACTKREGGGGEETAGACVGVGGGRHMKEQQWGCVHVAEEMLLLVLTLTRGIKSVVIGQAPVALTWKITPGKTQGKPKVVHACIIAEAIHASAKIQTK